MDQITPISSELGVSWSIYDIVFGFVSILPAHVRISFKSDEDEGRTCRILPSLNINSSRHCNSTSRIPTNHSHTHLRQYTTMDFESSVASIRTEDLPHWQMFFDLQCPYSKKLWDKVPAIKAKYGSDYKITTHITSLAFHRQAFAVHCAAYLIGIEKGGDARHAFENACFAKMDRYSDSEAVDKMTKADLDQVLATIAQEEKLLDEKGDLTNEKFLASLSDRIRVIMPTWFEHKEALALGVFKTPQHVLNGTLLPDTDSSWGVDDYEAALVKNL